MRGLMNLRKPRAFLVFSAFVVALVIITRFVVASNPGDPGSGDWPMWGGTPDRNMVSNMKGLRASWNIEKKTNVKWVSAIGSQSYGNPVVAGGTVFLGTNNEGLRDPKQGG